MLTVFCDAQAVFVLSLVLIVVDGVYILTVLPETVHAAIPESDQGLAVHPSIDKFSEVPPNPTSTCPPPTLTHPFKRPLARCRTPGMCAKLFASFGETSS